MESIRVAGFCLVLALPRDDAPLVEIIAAPQLVLGQIEYYLQLVGARTYFGIV